MIGIFSLRGYPPRRAGLVAGHYRRDKTKLEGLVVAKLLEFLLALRRHFALQDIGDHAQLDDVEVAGAGQTGALNVARHHALPLSELTPGISGSAAGSAFTIGSGCGSSVAGA